MTTTHVLGYPRIGEKRQLKFALEKYWRGEIEQGELEQVGDTIRQDNWQVQSDANLSFLTSGDFAWYDHVLATSLLLGHVPNRHRDQNIELDTLFNIARGQASQSCDCSGLAASDMTKWFNTNYHYIVPEFSSNDTFSLSWTQLFDETKQAIESGRQVKPVLLGPVSYLYLGKEVESNFDRLSLLPDLLITYQEILARFSELGIDWVQIDEPILALELDDKWLAGLDTAYANLTGRCKLLLTSYFDSLTEYLDRIVTLPVQGLHIDLAAAPEQLDKVLEKLPRDWVLSAGIVNGRNVWKTDLDLWLKALQPVKQKLGERLWLASSCSLLHSPVDLDLEGSLSDGVKSWFAFAKQKVAEVTLLAEALDGDQAAIEECDTYSQPIAERRQSDKIHKPKVQERVSKLDAHSSQRTQAYPDRALIQKEKLNLPLLPTTTIGSFPQTPQVRAQRRAYKEGRLSEGDYKAELEKHIEDAVRRQESLGLDVLVHGEAERNDMVEYFAEHLQGFQTTRFGWVQSYGSRCVKPAIVVADIERAAPITVQWSAFAQSLTNKKMKGMLTGPVTILCWTFPREDISRQQIAQQLALALHDEVCDLQEAGIDIIQIDEPALREGLPLKHSDHKHYLDWAVEAFKLSASGAKSATQIHTHMCYSEFNEIIESVAALDADVITIETSRSNMELLEAFQEFEYPNAIGPGVYDIHSPVIPSQDWIKNLLHKAAEKIPAERLWANPDCGLKTRNWQETEAALSNLVAAAKYVRQQWSQQLDLKEDQKATSEA
ncbi:5-methyltetrahydropteroyltriglutamate--homocysteine S-methyltransferase [Vibrio profundum]|uniref:5-methyltetrahydropteroyltriglutamate-- homocysteine S-methyltransferase n=1 Tax=Vibrio profundum TaxID=2910247 RepID=UPI003D0E9858